MPQPSDEPSPSLYDRARDLFDRSWVLPPAERAAFMEREANGDPQLLAAAMSLQAAFGTNPDAQGQGAKQQWLDEQATAQQVANAPGIGPDQVQPTSSTELLAKLATAPKLDTSRYRLEGRIGSGGMGVVSRIHDQQLNRRLAMKVPLERLVTETNEEQRRSLARFLEEAQVTGQLDHPGVVPVHDLGMDQSGRVYFTMRLVKGGTASEAFSDAHKRTNDWTITRALEIILKVCDTMAYAHDKGVLHRDLKPANVMVGKFGEVYVMDWGLAKLITAAGARDLHPVDDPAVAHEAPLKSLPGQTPGTPNYMAPEQARGETMDVRADVYSIGAMLYELLTGRAPYAVTGKDGDKIRKDVAEGPPKRIEEIEQGVPVELVAIADKAMHRDREQRYASTTALAADLRAFLGSQVVSAYRTGALVELQLWVRRNKPLAASLVAAALILVAGIVFTTVYADQAAENLKVAKENEATATRLATEKSALAASETAAKQSETTAKEAAQHSAEQLAAKVRDFNQLGADVRYRSAIAKQEELWPAWPDKIEALERWLREDCGKLLAMETEIRRTVEDLRAQSLPLAPEQVETDRRSHSKFAEFELLTKQVASLRYAQTIRSGQQTLVVRKLSPEQQALDPKALNALAWPRVAPNAADRTVWGEEALGLAAARAAVLKDGGSDDGYQYLDTLAWALLANGQDAEAKAKSAEALADAPADQQKDYAAYQQDLGAATDNAAAILSKAEATLAELTTQVSERRTWMFPSTPDGEAARFLHETLTELMGKLGSLAQKEKADVELRLRWAREVAAVSKAHPLAKKWASAREAIAKADGVVANTKYAGISIPLPEAAVIGLVPIGMNPVTKLWEFYELRSAWDGKQALGEIPIPSHNADGSIEVTGATGIVFVLLPGGTVTLGSQTEDKDAPYYDAQRAVNETLHMVTLSPFFMARHELTQGQWARLMTWNTNLRTPSNYKSRQRVAGKPITLAHPVEQVDWPMCNTLLTRHGMVLPSEAQWEYGCRGGTSTPWSVEFAHLQVVANLADADARASGAVWPAFETWADGHIVHAPVGSFGANRFGLHDVHGNVWEWCRDQESYYGPERGGDGMRPDSSDRSANRCSRGASFNDPAMYARSADRSHNAPLLRSSRLGLRPARLIPH